MQMMINKIITSIKLLYYDKLNVFKKLHG